MRPQTQGKLEAYLHRATRGTWGRKRAELKLELRGSIEARAHNLSCLGLTPENALEQAIAEMGNANSISAGFAKVHTMPNILRGSILTVALGAMMILSLNSSTTAQVQTVVPKVQYLSPMPDDFRTTFVRLNDIRTQLEAAGVNVVESFEPVIEYSPKGFDAGEGQNWVFDVPAPSSTRTITATFPDALDAPVKLQAVPKYSVNAQGLNPTFEADEDVYISARYFVNWLRETKLPISINRWINPTLTIGQTSVRLGAPGQVADFSFAALDIVFGDFYFKLLPKARLPKSGTMQVFRPNRAANLHSVRVDAPPGTMFAVMLNEPGTNMTPRPPGGYMYFCFARVNDQGVLQFDAPWRTLEFTNNIKALEVDYAAMWTQKSGVWNRTNAFQTRVIGLKKMLAGQRDGSEVPLHAMLLRMTGRLDEGGKMVDVVLPVRLRSVAHR